MSPFMYLWKRVIEQRLAKITNISDNQFGFVLEISTIFSIRQLIEKFRKEKSVYGIY